MSEIKKYVPGGEFLRLESLKQIQEAAVMFSKGELVPRDFQGKPANIIIAWQAGHELGLKPFQALKSIAVINGRATLWGDGLLAVVMAHPDFEDIEEQDFETIRGQGFARCTVHRKGRKPKTRTFSLKEAELAGLLQKKGPWQQYPERMLQMRARGFACRDSFPDALSGIQMAEEVRDYVDVTAKATVEAVTPAKAEDISSTMGVVISSQDGTEPPRVDDFPSEAPGEALRAPLVEMLKAIDAAKSAEELAALKPPEGLTDEELEIARQAFSTKRAEL